jgi:hypothetical protein
MRNRIQIYEPEIANIQDINKFNTFRNVSAGLAENSPVLEVLASEGHESLVNYIEWLGLAKDQNLVVLSSRHHYYYDSEEMKNVKTVVNLKELNLIKEVKNFLHSVFRILPSKSFFIGCFIDNRKQNGYILRKSPVAHHSMRNSEAVENGIVSKIPFLNMLYSFMDSKTNKYLSKTNVTLLLENNGFKVMDMTELNGLTYFCAKSLRTSDN